VTAMRVYKIRFKLDDFAQYEHLFRCKRQADDYGSVVAYVLADNDVQIALMFPEARIVARYSAKSAENYIFAGRIGYSFE
jgi:hypothetical protein